MGQGPGLKYLSSLAEWDGKSKFGLEGVKAVMKKLGDPQDKIKSVIIGGTNGKGSVSAAIAAIIASTGEKVGLNTSPHLSRINERVVLEGTSIEDALLNEFASAVQKAAEKAGFELSFHEAITATSFLAIKELACSWGVFEVGVGGRLDASNIIKRPEASAIVSIAYDHMQLLGDTLEKIAFEKAGILREGRIAVTGEIEKAPLSVIEKEAHSVSAVLYRLREEYFIESDTNSESSSYFKSRQLGELQFKSALEGSHQSYNMAVAICTGRALGASIESCKKGVEGVCWPGRLEWVEYKGSRVLLDCSHNPAGINSLMDYVRSRGLTHPRIVFGALSTKQWQEMVDVLSEISKDWALVEPKAKKAVTCSEINSYLSSFGIKGEEYSTNYERVLEAIERSSNDREWIVAGSIYLVGAMRELFQVPTRRIWQN